MRKISELTMDEKDMETAAALLSPTAALASDKDFKELTRNGTFSIDGAVKLFVKKHPDKIVEIIAILKDMTYDDYREQSNAVSFMLDLSALTNDNGFWSLFGFQLRSAEKTSSGAAPETTEA